MEHEGVRDPAGGGGARRRGAAGPDPHDGAGGRAGPGAAGALRRAAGQRDPGADGHRHPVRPAHLDGAEHGRGAGAVSALRFHPAARRRRLPRDILPA
ncbi:MAG: hypothetical protein MZW92_17730 [Comamonadaceae bacterium]|nr:hypothetical protein [Comamonadaceae bacterium]